MSNEKRKDSVAESGCRTPRENWSPGLLRKQRLKLGLTYSFLSSLFNVSWSTLRNWELGLARPTDRGKEETLRRFIRGEFDKELLAVRARRLESNYIHVENVKSLSGAQDRLSKEKYWRANLLEVAETPASYGKQPEDTPGQAIQDGQDDANRPSGR